MMTLDALKHYGANTAEGMGRCLNNESFYLKMVGMALADKNFDRLKEAVDAGDTHAAFAAAHSLKGSIGNVALTPIYEPRSQRRGKRRCLCECGERDGEVGDRFSRQAPAAGRG